MSESDDDRAKRPNRRSAGDKEAIRITKAAARTAVALVTEEMEKRFSEFREGLEHDRPQMSVEDLTKVALDEIKAEDVAMASTAQSRKEEG